MEQVKLRQLLPHNFEWRWDKSIHLTFGRPFNQQLDNIVLPPHLKNLVFGACFDQSLDAVDLSASLTFGHSFSHSLECIRMLPALTHLTLGRYNSTTLVVLPLSVTLQRAARQFSAAATVDAPRIWPLFQPLAQRRCAGAVLDACDVWPRL